VTAALLVRSSLHCAQSLHLAEFATQARGLRADSYLLLVVLWAGQVHFRALLRRHFQHLQTLNMRIDFMQLWARTRVRVGRLIFNCAHLDQIMAATLDRVEQFVEFLGVGEAHLSQARLGKERAHAFISEHLTLRGSWPTQSRLRFFGTDLLA